MAHYITRDKNRHVVALGESRNGWRAAQPVDAQGRATGPAYWLSGRTIVEKYPDAAAAHRELERKRAAEDRIMRHLTGKMHTMTCGKILGPAR